MGTAGPDTNGVRAGSFARVAALTYGANASAAVLSLVNVLIVARALGASGRGDVAFLIAVAAIAANLSAFGVQESNANVGASDARLRPSLATNSLALAALFGAAAALLVVALTALFPAVGGEVARPLLLIALAGVPVMILKSYLTFLIQAEYGFAVTNLAWIAGPATTAAANGFLAALGELSVTTAITAWVGGQVLGLVLLVGYVTRHAGFGSLDVVLAARTLAFGVKTHVGRFMAVGNYRLDHWFLGAMSGSRELGLYSVAVAWAELLFYVPGVLVMIQRPDLVRASGDDAAKLAARVFRVGLVLALVAAAGLVLAAPILCTAVFGQEFRGSVDDLRVLAVAAFGIVALELLGSALNARRRPLLATAAVAIAFVTTIMLDLLLIPRYGGLGAAVATSAAWTIGGIAVALLFTRALAARADELVPRTADVAWMWRTARTRIAPSVERVRGGSG